MTYTPIPAGTSNWDVPLNAALVDQDTRITNNGNAMLQKANNLSDVANVTTSRTNLGLGAAATLNVGTTTGTVAAGDDSRITGAAQKSNNLSDLTNAATARTNLALGGAATLNVGTTTGTVAAGDDSRITGAAQKASNLSDLASAATARTNLGLGGAAVLNVGTITGTVAAGDDSRITGALQTTGGTMSGAIAMGTNKITGIGNGSAAQDAAAFGQIPTAGTGSTNYTVGNDARILQAYNSTSKIQGFATWNYDSELPIGTGAGVNVSGTIYLHKVYLAQGQTITGAATGVQTAGATLTSGQNLMGLYDSSGNRVAVTADQSAVWTSTGYKSANFTASYSVTTAGFFYVAILAVGTTPPAFYQAANALSVLFNANVAAGSFRHCTGPTAQTSLPATITLGSTSASTFNTWIALF